MALEERHIVSGRLVLADRLEPGRIVVQGDRILAIELDDAAAGPYISPGLVDIHVHGWGGYDATGGVAELAGMAKALLRRGVTSFLPTAATASIETLRGFAADVRRFLHEPPPNGAEACGFNLEGPFISRRKPGAQDQRFICTPTEVPLAELEPFLDGLRLVTVAPEEPGALALIAWLRGHGVVISLGHSAATVHEALAGYAAGARSTTHLFNGMSGVDHHAPGLAVVALAADDVYTELIADGYHVDRALWPLVLRLKPVDRLILVTDAIFLAGTSQRGGVFGDREVRVEDDHCVLASSGILCGSVIGLDMAVRNLARAGVELPRAAAAASANPCALLGLNDRGLLAPGLRADLVEFDDEISVRRVMRGGSWIA
jgi:N-acetylglucosamine-6-phosphate deacetylase